MIITVKLLKSEVAFLPCSICLQKASKEISIGKESIYLCWNHAETIGKELLFGMPQDYVEIQHESEYDDHG